MRCIYLLSLKTPFLFSHNFFVEETRLLGGMSVWEYGRELRIKQRAGQGRMGWVGEGQTAGTAIHGKEPGRGGPFQAGRKVRAAEGGSSQ